MTNLEIENARLKKELKQLKDRTDELVHDMWSIINENDAYDGVTRMKISIRASLKYLGFKEK